jgi:chromate transporter
MHAPQALKEVVAVFLKLGTIGFGGPAATITMMEDECVERRKWLPREQFLDILGMTNLIPGPNAFEMAIHIGLLRAGWLGFLLAGAAFILPATLITLAFAWIYVQAGTVTDLQPFLIGIRAAVLAVIVASMWRLGKSAVKSIPLAVIGAMVVALSLVGVDEIAALFAGAFGGMLWLRATTKPQPIVMGLAAIGNSGVSSAKLTPFVLATAAVGGVSTGVVSISLWQIGLFFLKIGAVLYGSGYVLIAFLEGGLVQQHGWLTRNQLLDAIAVGQFTPGPLLSTATFIGYLLAGVSGAIVATVAVFLPSFVFVAFLHRFLPRLRRSPWAAAFLDAVNVSAMALMVVVAINLGRQTMKGYTPWLVFAAAAALHLRWKTNPAWLILAGAAIGWFLLRLN